MKQRHRWAQEEMAGVAKELVEAHLGGYFKVALFSLIKGRKTYTRYLLRIALQAQPWWAPEKRVADVAKELGIEVTDAEAGRLKLYQLNNKI